MTTIEERRLVFKIARVFESCTHKNQLRAANKYWRLARRYLTRQSHKQQLKLLQIVKLVCERLGE